MTVIRLSDFSFLHVRKSAVKCRYTLNLCNFDIPSFFKKQLKNVYLSFFFSECISLQFFKENITFLYCLNWKTCMKLYWTKLLHLQNWFLLNKAVDCREAAQGKNKKVRFFSFYYPLVIDICFLLFLLTYGIFPISC